MSFPATFAVISCKRYSDAWHPFGELFAKFWPQFRGPKVLISDLAFGRGIRGFDQLVVQEDRGWIQNLADGLREIHTDLVILSQEDFFLSNPVRYELVIELCSWLLASKYDSVRIFPCPGAKGKRISDGLGVIDPGEPYRCSCQMAIWDRSSLIRLCEYIIAHGGKTAVDFERLGQDGCDGYNMAGWREDSPRNMWPVVYTCSAIARGKWMRGSLALCKQHGIKLKREREVEPLKDGDFPYDIEGVFE